MGRTERRVMNTGVEKKELNSKKLVKEDMQRKNQ